MGYDFRFVELPNGFAKVVCNKCGWAEKPMPISPFDPCEALAAAPAMHPECPVDKPSQQRHDKPWRGLDALILDEAAKQGPDEFMKVTKRLINAVAMDNGYADKFGLPFPEVPTLDEDDEVQ